MFDFGRKRQEEIIVELIGATETLNRSLAQLLSRVDPLASQNQVKLSYYSMATVTYAFFRYSKEPDEKKVEILDTYTGRLLTKSLECQKQPLDPGSQVSARWIRDYQNAHASYRELLHKVFGQTNNDSAITLMMVLWQTITGKTAQGKMIELAACSAILLELTGEAINMVRQRT